MGDNSDLVGGETSRSTPLYKVLHDGLPAHRSQTNEGVLDCRKLGDDLGISDKAIYRWFDRQSVPPKKVKPLMGLPGSTLTMDALLAFVLED
ncbi:hypothetical protein [Neoaquamicrobium sediminum]|uniref:hypothetical protein n=1 Tax=Neoaquamicrobium sediminum TaxID=1849104 RepID=UPI001567BB8D|nr:hypothetical protein [Mesorhizobium sediminum]NRC54191.1 hypothetical protein [Mesorhizobium sediminum]